MTTTTITFLLRSFATCKNINDFVSKNGLCEDGIWCWTLDVGRVGMTVDAATVEMRRSVDIQVVRGGLCR